MILTVSLSPCLETNIEVDTLAVGKVNRVISKRLFMTGKALNVATGIARLGGESFATGFMYEENGRLFEQELHKEGVTYKFVWKKGRVKEVIKFVDRRSMLTEVIDEATPLNAADGEKLLAEVEELAPKCQAVIISGECPKGLSADYMCKVLAKVPENVIKIVDTDGDRLINLVKMGVDLAKPNLDELQKAMQLKITDRESMESACRMLVKLGAKRVLLSLGKRGAVMCNEKHIYYCTSLNVAMNSTAGAGDAMVAAAAQALMSGCDDTEILKCGVAAGTASVTLPDSISFLKSKYDEVLNMVTIKEI